MKHLSKIKPNYKNIVCSELTFQLNSANIMEIPTFEKVIVVSQMSTESVKQVTLALEILCGQRCFYYESSAASKSSSFAQKRTKLLLPKNSKQLLGTNRLVRCCLRKENMYNFLNKIITVLSFSHFTTTIHKNMIQFTLKPNLLRLFPEIQNQIELFFQIAPLQVFVFTTAKSVSENRTFWASFLQKEITRYV